MLLPVFLAASFLLQKCFTCIVCVQRECFHWNWRVGGWEAVGSKAAAVSCGQIGAPSMCSVHSGSMGLFNTSTLYPHGSADRAAELFLFLLSHLSLPLFLCLDIRMHNLFHSFYTTILFLQYFKFKYLLLSCLVKPQSLNVSWLNRNESRWLCIFNSHINCVSIKETW